MNDVSDKGLSDYYASAQSWADDREQSARRSKRLAWTIAGLAVLVAVLEAFALAALLPLRRDVPYTVLVDRQTGNVEALRPYDEEIVSVDAALTRSFLVQYVVARESFDLDLIQHDYRKVMLMSAGDARRRYAAQMRAGSPGNPLVRLPRGSGIEVDVKSVTSLSGDSALVRFDTITSAAGGSGAVSQSWAAVIRYRYSNAEMSEADRLINPLGFQVIRYRRSQETLGERSTEAASPEGEGSEL